MEWNVTVFNNSVLEWLTALAVAGAINLTVGLIKQQAVRRLRSATQGTRVAMLAEGAIAVLERTRQFLVLLVSLHVATQSLELPERVGTALRMAATVSVFIQIGLWIDGGFQFWMNRYRERLVKSDPGTATSLGALKFIGQFITWVVLMLVGLDNLGINVTALVAGLGVGGIAVALAVQNILGDLFASLSIVIDKPFVVGDFIIVDNFMGAVEYVGLKTTRIRSLSGEQIIFSNSDLLNARVRNFKRMLERRVVFGFGVVYQTPPELVAKIPGMVREIIGGQELARIDRAHFFKFGESSLDFEVVYWMKDPDYAKYMDVQQAVNLEMMRRFAQEGIAFAHPLRTLFIKGPVQVAGPSREEGSREEEAAVGSEGSGRIVRPV